MQSLINVFGPEVEVTPERDEDDAVRVAFGRFWDRAEEISGLEPLQVKTFMAFGMLLNIVAALDARGLPVSWAEHATIAVPAALYEGIPRSV